MDFTQTYINVMHVSWVLSLELDKLPLWAAQQSHQCGTIYPAVLLYGLNPPNPLVTLVCYKGSLEF